MVQAIEASCAASGNKQLFDQAGQTFGHWWMFGRSDSFLNAASRLIPIANTLMSMAVTLHLDRDLAAELPILKRYIEIDPSNPQALRMAVQVAGSLGDRTFTDEVLALMQRHPQRFRWPSPSLNRLLAARNRSHPSDRGSSHGRVARQAPRLSVTG